MNNNIYKIGFFILVVINIVLVGIFTLRPKPPLQPMGTKDEIRRELKFSEEQNAMFEAMVREHQKTIRDLEDQEQELVGSFFNQLSLDNPNEDKEVLLQKIVQLEKDKIMATYHHFEQLKRICNEEQLIKFDRVVKQIIPRLTHSSERPMNPDRPPF